MIRSMLGVVACAALAAPAAALTSLPPANATTLFDNFFAPDGSFVCGKATGLGSRSCSGVDVLFEPEPQITGHFSGAASITNPPTGGPTVTASLTASGIGVPGVKAQLDYYVTVLPLGTLPTAGLQIPLVYDDAGNYKGSVSNGALAAEAATAVSQFAGNVLVDHLTTFQNDDISDFVISSSLDRSYGNTHHVVFDFSDGDAVAKVSLLANCGIGSLNPAGMSGTCDATADPIFSFDQAAFDAEMGAHTCNLADNFQIAISAGLTASGVPESASWALMITGFGLAGASLRARRARAAA